MSKLWVVVNWNCIDLALLVIFCGVVGLRCGMALGENAIACLCFDVDSMDLASHD